MSFFKTLSGHGFSQRFPLLHKIFFRVYQTIQSKKVHSFQLPTGAILQYFPHQLGVGFYLKHTQTFEPYTTQLFQKLLKPGDIVIDIGANIGYYTLIASQLVGNNGHVYAFEPEPNNRDLLKNNIQKNHLSNINVYPYAVSNRQGKTKLFLSHTSGEHSTTTPSNHSIIVKTTTLDHFMKHKKIKPTFIKIDTEGAESQIIFGALQMLKNKYKPYLILEYSSPLIKHFDLLSKLGYRLSIIDEVSSKLIPANEQSVNQYSQKVSFFNLLAQQ